MLAWLEGYACHALQTTESAALDSWNGVVAVLLILLRGRTRWNSESPESKIPGAVGCSFSKNEARGAS